ncbi:SRPBCC family protein [Halobacterium zhouii]|uniref:SRPBCC family protein n=1 Tax=Halobacterium zhouii TaxID=2902624 RepID=UPI001E3A39F6|nr:SRPBCC family protein [Halobacterium zhouii]
MATYERTVRVHAPLADVWAFHATIDGLVSLTPDWAELRVDGIESPGGSDSNVLVPGTRVRLSVRPFGVGPRIRWTSRIVEREERESVSGERSESEARRGAKQNDGVAYFVDEMESGPLPEWRHEHYVYGDGGETLVRDRVTYRAPAGRVGTALVDACLVSLFYYRHRRMRDIFE